MSATATLFIVATVGAGLVAGAASGQILNATKKKVKAEEVRPAPADECVDA